MNVSKVKKLMDSMGAKSTELENLVEELDEIGYEPEGEEADDLENMIQSIYSLNYEIAYFAKKYGYDE